MKIDYVARHFRLDEKTRGNADKKLRKVSRFLEEPIEIRVILDVINRSRVADIHASHRYGVLQATEETDTFEGAINLAVDKIEKQARRSRRKAKGRKRRNNKVGGDKWPLEVLAPDSLAAPDGPRIVESVQLSIKPMNLEEAALELQSSENQFVVFRDADSERVSVLYRRRDENYGLIRPEF